MEMSAGWGMELMASVMWEGIGSANWGELVGGKGLWNQRIEEGRKDLKSLAEWKNCLLAEWKNCVFQYLCFCFELSFL